MSEMIDRVAKAICSQLWGEAVWDRSLLSYDATLPKSLRSAADECREMARAAIQAMRTPTEAMIDAGNESGDWGPGINCDDSDASPEGAWRAMIDEALKP